MSDDDQPASPRTRTRSSWGDDERAAVGREHRSSGKTPTESQLRRARRDAANAGVPIAIASPMEAETDGERDEVTSPIDLLDRDPGPEVHDIIRRSRRESGAPATVEDIAALKLSIDRQRGRDRSSSEEARKVLAMLPSPDELKEIRAAVGKVKTASVVLKTAAILAIGATTWAVDKILTRVGTDSANAVRIERLEKDVEWMLHNPRPAAQKDPTP